MRGRFDIESDDESDFEFAEDDSPDNRGFGANMSRGASGYGGGSGMMSGGMRGSAYDNYGGGNDAYNFDFNFDSKAAPFSMDGLDLDGPRKSGKPSTNAPRATASVAKATPKPKASPGLGSTSGKTGSMAATKLDIDKKFNFESRFGNAKSSATAKAAPKPADDKSDFLKFLDDSDSGSEDDAPKQKTNAKNPDPSPGLNTSAFVSSRTADDGRKEDSSGSDVSSPSPPTKNDRVTGHSETNKVVDTRRDDDSLSDDLSESDIKRSPRASASRTATSGKPNRTPSSHSRSPSHSPAPSPRAGFRRSASPVSNRSRASSRSNESRTSIKSRSRPSSVESDSHLQSSEKPTKVAPQTAIGGKATASTSAPRPTGNEKSVADVMAKLQAEVEDSLSSENSQQKHGHTATYTEDFAGESTAQALGSVGPLAQTYQDDFEDDREASDSDRPQHGNVIVSKAATLQPVSTTPVTSAPTATSRPLTTITRGPGGFENNSESATMKSHVIRHEYPDAYDDGYRPRRPTCDVGIQANVPVDVGVQCDPPQDPRAPDDPFGPWMQSVGTSGFPAAPMFGAPPGQLPPFLGGGLGTPPFGQFGAAPHMPGMMANPYAALGYPMHPLLGVPQPGMPGESPLLRQLFASAISKPHPSSFAPPTRADTTSGPREAFTAATTHTAAETEKTATPTNAEQNAQSFTGLDSLSGYPRMASHNFGIPYSYGAPFAQSGHSLAQSAHLHGVPMDAFGTAPGIGALVGGATPAAMAALAMVDESFREQVALLRKAAVVHRSRLEKARMPPPSNFTTAAKGLGMPTSAFPGPMQAPIQEARLSPRESAKDS